MLDLGIKLGMRRQIPSETNKSTYLSSLHVGEDTTSLLEGGYAMAKSTFDLFLRAGYPFEETEFVVVDDISDSYLQNLIMHDEKKYGEIESDDDEED